MNGLYCEYHRQFKKNKSGVQRVEEVFNRSLGRSWPYDKIIICDDGIRWVKQDAERVVHCKLIPYSSIANLKIILIPLLGFYLRIITTNSVKKDFKDFDVKKEDIARLKNTIADIRQRKVFGSKGNPVEESEEYAFVPFESLTLEEMLSLPKNDLSEEEKAAVIKKIKDAWLAKKISELTYKELTAEYEGRFLSNFEREMALRVDLFHVKSEYENILREKQGKKDRNSIIKGAVVGGVLAGPTGAVVGAIVGKNKADNNK